MGGEEFWWSRLKTLNENFKTKLEVMEAPVDAMEEMRLRLSLIKFEDIL